MYEPLNFTLMKPPPAFEIVIENDQEICYYYNGSLVGRVFQDPETKKYWGRVIDQTTIYVDAIEPCRKLVEGLLDRFKKQGRVARFIKKGKPLEDPRYIKRELVDKDEPTDLTDEEYE